MEDILYQKGPGDGLSVDSRMRWFSRRLWGILSDMRATIVIASHNEGSLLWRTVQSCIRTVGELDVEIVVADDASTDGSLDHMRHSLAKLQRRHSGSRLPEVRVVAHPQRAGVSPTKDLGARSARGEVLVLLDGHCRPQRGAVRRLIEDVEELDGDAIIMPRIPHVDGENMRFRAAHNAVLGFCLSLRELECAWIARDRLARHDRFYESPALIGCCAAVSRQLYERLWGFDPHMIQWGSEDVDFGLKAWLMGHPILLDARATIGHRFRANFDNYTVAEESVLVNKLRMARKNFTDRVWEHWIALARSVEYDKAWDAAWSKYLEGRESVERERAYLMANRVRAEWSPPASCRTR